MKAPLPLPPGHCQRRAITCLLMLCCVAGTGCFRMGGDARALRDSVLSQATFECEEKIELGVVFLTVSLARAGLSFVEIDRDARTILNSVHGADVGIYDIRRRAQALDRGAIIKATDREMLRKGWDRLVLVADGRHDLVAVYVQQKGQSPHQMKACVLVLNREQMIIASTQSDLEPLLELAFEKAPFNQARREIPTHRGI